MSKLTHFNEQGDAHMINVGNKAVSARMAVACGKITMKPETLQHVISGEHKKGDVIGIARIAAIMAAKKTAELIPLCHQITLDEISVDFEPISSENSITCKVTAKTHAQTGVEMEALTAVQVGLLTIYDMCKSVDRGMVISNVHLIEKLGGKSGHWKADNDEGRTD